MFIILLIIGFICLKKFGREKTLSFAIKVMSPILIIVFYLSEVSIILPILKVLNVSNSIVTTSDSIRVAIDSAIVTLFVNTILVMLNSPIKVTIESRNRQDLEQVITYCDRPVYVDYNVQVNFRYKWVKKLYKRFWKPCLYILNSKDTSIVIDKIEEYSDIINCDNASKHIKVDLTNISNSGKAMDKLYFTLGIQSNKTKKWDDVIEAKVYINDKEEYGIHKLFWEVDVNELKLVHRSEII